MPDHVRITDASGAVWSAQEVPASRIILNDEVVEERPAHLRFAPLHDTAGSPRIGRSFPRDWQALPMERLVELLAEAEPVTRSHGNSDDAVLRQHLDDLST